MTFFYINIRKTHRLSQQLYRQLLIELRGHQKQQRQGPGCLRMPEECRGVGDQYSMVCFDH